MVTLDLTALDAQYEEATVTVAEDLGSGRLSAGARVKARVLVSLAERGLIEKLVEVSEITETSAPTAPAARQGWLRSLVASAASLLA